ncbi:MAG: TrmB family transcriptional regulator [Halobacteriaceae archaeon]
MTVDPTDDPRGAAVETLQEFGLSTYADRSFVGLIGLGTGTAKEVSRVADVPRTRVYDAMDELCERGLVDVQQTTPKEFWSVSAETARRTFEKEFADRADRLTESLSNVEPEARREEQRGVWTVEGQPAVTDRVLDFLDDAEEEVVFMTVTDLLTDDVVDALGRAADRDVDIRVGGVSPAVADELESAVPGAETFESLWLWSDTPAGRLLLVDRSRTLVSVLVNGADADFRDPRSETAIWGSGAHNSLVVVLKANFTWRLEDGRADAGEGQVDEAADAG